MNHQTWEWLIRASWQASVLCGLVLVAQKLLGKRLSAAWRCNLWLLVACRFLLPFSVQSPLSVYNLAVRGPVPSNLGPPNTVSRGVPDSGIVATQPQYDLSRVASASRADGAPEIAPQNQPVAPRQILNWRAVLPALWLSGVACAVLWMAASAVWFRWRLRPARQTQDPRVPDLLAQCAREMGVRGRVRVFESRAVTSPALCGLWRPRILMPTGMTGTLDTAQLRFIFLHELAHVKRRDVAACWLMTAAQALHWFNPLAWLASRRLRVEREVACDALVLNRAGAGGNKPYGETILRLVQELGRPTFAPGMLGMLRDDGGLRRRMILIANFTPTTSRTLLPVLAFAVLAAVGLTDPLTMRGAYLGDDVAMLNPPAGFRLRVDMKDGSRIVGTSGVQGFAVRDAADGQMTTLPLETISGVRWDGAYATVNFVTPGAADKRVEFLDDSIPVDSSLGPLKLPMTQIKQLTVSVIRQVIVPTRGLVAYWSGDGLGADSAGDHDGTLENVRFVKGVVGRQAFSFNPMYGGWTGIKVADSPAFELTNSLTVVAWVRPRGDGRVFFFRGDNRPGWDPYLLAMDENMNVGFKIWGADGQTVSIGTPLQEGAWTHVAAVLDGDTGAMSIYTNGILAVQTNTAVRPFGPLQPESSPGVGIGNLNDGGNSFPYVGDLDEIGLYSRALSPTEIWGIYNQHSANAGERAEPFNGTPTQNIPRLIIDDTIHL